MAGFINLTIILILFLIAVIKIVTKILQSRTVTRLAPGRLIT